MLRGCRHGERPTRGIGDERQDKEGRGRMRRLRYKITAPRRRLKSLKILKTWRKMRYKISGATNRLF